MNTEDNSDIKSSSGEDDHDLTMRPPIEKAIAETELDCDALDDMNDGLVHHFPRHLLNSTCDSSLLDKRNTEICVYSPKLGNQENQLQETGKRHWLAANFETIGSKCYTGRMERNNQDICWCVQSYVFWWLGFACDK